MSLFEVMKIEGVTNMFHGTYQGAISVLRVYEQLFPECHCEQRGSITIHGIDTCITEDTPWIQLV